MNTATAIESIGSSIAKSENFITIAPIRTTIHPTKFAYEAYPFSDRMENDLLEKIMSLTKHSYDEGETWYELSKQMLYDLAEWRNDVIRTFAKKLVQQRAQYTTANTDTDEKILFDITRHIITNSSIFEKIFQEETLSVEDIQAAITSRPEERENIKDMAQWFINQGINAIAKKVHFELVLQSCIQKLSHQRIIPHL